MSSFNNVPPQLWMLLDKGVRNFLAKKFNLIMTGPAEIRDQEVISDGYNVEDLRVITHQMLEEYIGPTESFARAWELACAEAYREVYMIPTFKPASVDVETMAIPEPVEVALVTVEEEIINKIEKNDNNKKNK